MGEVPVNTPAINAFFTLDMDELLKNAVGSKLHRSGKRWDAVASIIPGVSEEMCEQRWQQLEKFITLKHQGFAIVSKTRMLGITIRDGNTNKTRQNAKSAVIKCVQKSRGTPSETSQEIVIHVCDEARKVNRDFTCEREILLEAMGYFKTYLSDNEAYEDLDISVHCDVHVFDWLMRFVKSEKPSPVLSVKNIVSILISSEFLQMQTLVDLSLNFFCEHIQEILHCPIDLSCINSKLLGIIARRFSCEALSTLVDKNEKLLNQLFMHKLEELLSDDSNALDACANCGKLFTKRQQAFLTCPNSKVFIDYRGEVVARHADSGAWDLQRCFVALRARKASWINIFWKFWALVNDLYCTRCNQRFNLSELGHCSYHPLAPRFQRGKHEGEHPCCQYPALRFDTLYRRSGCRARNHTVDTTNDDRQILDIVMNQRDIVLLPFNSKNELSELTSLGLVRSNSSMELTRSSRANLSKSWRMNEFLSIPSSSTNTSKSTLQQSELQQWDAIVRADLDSDLDDSSSDSSASDLDTSNREDNEESGSDESTDCTGESTHNRASSRGDGSRSSAAFYSNSTHLKRTNISFSKGRPASSQGNRRTVRRIVRKRRQNDSINAMSPARRRAHRMDSLRDDDRRRMDSMVYQLRTMRSMKDPGNSTSQQPSKAPSKGSKVQRNSTKDDRRVRNQRRNR